jgi:hypothetical protein
MSLRGEGIILIFVIVVVRKILAQLLLRACIPPLIGINEPLSSLTRFILL